MTIDTPTSSSSHSTKIQTEQHTIVVEKEQVDTNATSSSPSSAFQSDPIEPNKNDMKEEIVEEEVVEKPTGLKQKIKGYFGIHLFSGILMVLAGVAIAFQAGCNATLNRYGGRSFSSVCTFLIAAICSGLFFIFDLVVLKTPRPSSKLKDAPWYAWIGGILGSFYVIINILTVPRLGTATVLSIFVCAQIITACIIDHFGLIGLPKRKYTIWRILASLALVGCVVVVAKF